MFVGRRAGPARRLLRAAAQSGGRRQRRRPRRCCGASSAAMRPACRRRPIPARSARRLCHPLFPRFREAGRSTGRPTMSERERCEDLAAALAALRGPSDAEAIQALLYEVGRSIPRYQDKAKSPEAAGRVAAWFRRSTRCCSARSAGRASAPSPHSTACRDARADREGLVGRAHRRARGVPSVTQARMRRRLIAAALAATVLLTSFLSAFSAWRAG